MPYLGENTPTDRVVVAVDAVGGPGRRGPFPVATEVLGWRDNNHLVTAGYFSEGSVWDLSLVDGRSTVLSIFDVPHTCEYYSQPCQVNEVMAAANLLPALTVVPARHPQRGLLHVRVLFMAVVVAGAMLALVTYAVIRRRTRVRSMILAEPPNAVRENAPV